MKVTQCEWAPSLVVEWLCGELEERGIPGPIYAHTLLSLLHTEFCPHTPVSSGISFPTSSSSRAHHLHPKKQLELQKLDLEEILNEATQHDADLPDLSLLTNLKVTFCLNK